MPLLALSGKNAKPLPEVLSPRIRPKARSDIAYIGAWISLDNPAAGLEFRDAVQREIRLLQMHPFLGRPRRFRKRGLRSWRIKGFEKYLIFYRPSRTTLEIVRVIHGARDLKRILGTSKTPR